MKIVITGALGFIGRHVINMLPTGNELYILSRKSTLENTGYANAQHIQADIADESVIDKLPSTADVIIHLAAAKQSGAHLHQVNVAGTRHLLSWAQTAQVKKIIHLSSVGVVGKQYSRKPVVIDENAYCEPKNEYEKTKLAAEEVCREVAAKSGIDLVILRPTNVFGEDHPNNALLNFLQRIKNASSLPYAATARVNYVYVKDVAACIIYFLQHTNTGTYNVGHAHTFEEMVNFSAQALQVKPVKKTLTGSVIKTVTPIVPLASLRAKLLQLTNAVEYSDKKLAALFAYPYGLKNGLHNLVQYYHNQQKL